MNRNYFHRRELIALVTLVGSAVFSGYGYAYQSGYGVCPSQVNSNEFCISAESANKKLRAAWTLDMQAALSSAQLANWDLGMDQDQTGTIPEFGPSQIIFAQNNKFGFWYRIGDLGPERPFTTLKFSKQPDSNKSIVHLQADTTDEIGKIVIGSPDPEVRNSLGDHETENQWLGVCKSGSSGTYPAFVPEYIDGLQTYLGKDHSGSFFTNYLYIPKWWFDRYPYFTDKLNPNADNPANWCELAWVNNLGFFCPTNLEGVEEYPDPIEGTKCRHKGFSIDLWYSLEIQDTGHVVVREQIKVSNAPKKFHLFRFTHSNYGLSDCAVTFDRANSHNTACGSLINGMQLSYIPGTFKKGDLNGDGQIDIDDVKILQNYVVDPTPVTEFEINGYGRSAPSASNLIYYQGGDENPSTLNDLFATKNYFFQESGGGIKSAVLWRWNFPDGNPVEIENVYLVSPNSATAFDVRDIDGDGKVTVLDARKLVLMCTKPRCAR